MIIRSLMLSLGVLLLSGSVMAGSPSNSDQDTIRPRRVQGAGSGFLGVVLSEVTNETVHRLKLREERGALIDGITDGSSAAQAGLQKNDVIVKWDGEPIESARELSRHIHETPAGRVVRLGVIRDGREIEVNVTLGARTAFARPAAVARPAPAAVRVRPEAIRPRLGGRSHLGVQLQGMTPQLAEYFGLSNRTGALVVFVFADSPAAKAGFKAGDVILSAGTDVIQNPMDIRRMLTNNEGTVDFKILRDKREQTLTVKLEKGSRSWLLEPDDSDFVGTAELLTVEIPRIQITPAAIAQPKINVNPLTFSMPKIDVAPLASPPLKIDLAPMKVQVPKIHLSPARILLLPGRIVL